MSQPLIESACERSATESVATVPTIPEDWTTNVVPAYYTYLREFAQYKVLLEHKEWFDKDFPLTYKYLSEQEGIKDTPLQSVLKRVNDESSNRKDDDFKTKVNVFRGNFFTKLAMTWSLLLKSTWAVPAYETVLQEWYGQEYDAVVWYVTSFEHRIGIRKNASKIEEELVNTLKSVAINNAETIIADEHVLNFLQRVEEAQHEQWVTEEEAIRAFEMNDFFIYFYETWRGKIPSTPDERHARIKELQKPIDTPYPYITPPLK